MMDYQEAWSYLNDLQFFKIKLGLDSMGAFLESLGNPQRDLRFIHVAGTNGKGSVCANLLEIYSRAGYRVGLYTSPHLSSVRERFRINDEYIPREEFAAEASAICDILGGRQITYFEFTTALALLWFAHRQVDLVILEVGLGGRLDATNVITPLVGVITNVAMDHEAYLGNTLAEIAAEKGGIVKPGVPLVSAVADSESREVVAGVCREKGAPLYLLGRDFRAEPRPDGSWDYHGINPTADIEGVRSGLLGDYQVDNSCLALAVVELLGAGGVVVKPEVVRAALPRVRWPGRLERLRLSEPGLDRLADQPTVDEAPTDYRCYLLDGAHNPAGVEGLARYLEGESFRELVLVWASMGDKDYVSSLARIVPLCRWIIFTRPEAERSASPEQLTGCLPPQFREKALVADEIGAALTLARSLTDGRDLIGVAGSLYLIGAVRQLLWGGVAE
ncbi:MAG TPA: folylpolyglutamate synthase/dihydrofolate synthase family protein [Desulfurivibrionaceae bacterium]|nr:folylpolyglutamate synthase/dihydrofolate synthase family protein [Desulfurivibrionaceae bacterium]